MKLSLKLSIVRCFWPVHQLCVRKKVYLVFSKHSTLDIEFQFLDLTQYLLSSLLFVNTSSVEREGHPRLPFRRTGGSFLMNFRQFNSIFLETFWYPEVGSMKYPRMYKLQFPSTIYNLLTKTHMERIGLFDFFKFSGMVWSWEFQWEHPFHLWRHQVARVTLFQNGFWSVNYTLGTWLKCFYFLWKMVP